MAPVDKSPSPQVVKKIFKFVTGVLNKAFSGERLPEYEQDIRSLLPDAPLKLQFSDACEALANCIKTGHVPAQGTEVVKTLLLKQSTTTSVALLEAVGLECPGKIDLAEQDTCTESEKSSVSAATVDAVLRVIRDAQDRGYQHRGEDGKRQSCASFAVARDEISAGQKRSHWIWYVWPSLAGLRRVKYQQFMLPGLAAAREYLRVATLRDRLIDITKLATTHLEQGVNPARLFGKMHRMDFPKFKEAMTFFAVAAHMNGDAGLKSLLLQGLSACNSGAPDENTVKFLLAHGTGDERLAVKDAFVPSHDSFPDAAGAAVDPVDKLLDLSLDEVLSKYPELCKMFDLGNEEQKDKWRQGWTLPDPDVRSKLQTANEEGVF